MLTYKEALLKATQYFNGEELPASVFLNKYALKDPKTGLFVEATPDDMHSRLADAFHKGVQLSKVKKNVFRSRDDIYDLLKDFKYIVPQGSVMSQLGNNYQIGSLSNCFVIGQPYDSYGGIFQKDQEQVQLMKRRGGVGIDISTLRPVHSKVSNAAGSSTGAVSFMHRFSNSTREVAQNGRRGALMLSMDIRHPESLEFAQIKQDLNKITGANISLFLTDDFMQAVELDRDFVCRFPVNSPTMIEFSNVNTANGESKNLWMDINDTHSPFLEFLPENQLREFKLWNKDETILVKKVKARKLWEEIIKCAHNTAEPGLMFIDKHLNYSPDGAYEAYRGVTTNPCSEIFMQPYDACRLICMNLLSCVTNPYTTEAELDLTKLYEIAYKNQLLADTLVDLEIEKIQTILTKVQNDPDPQEVKQLELDLWSKVMQVASNSRRTGTGFTALGDMLAALNLKYDSPQALKIINLVVNLKTKAELNASIDLAEESGAFYGWDAELEKGLSQHSDSFYYMIKHEFPEEWSRMQIHGRRNVSWSTVAPTGTVSLMTQTTSGIEPLFAPYYFRKKKVNPNDEGVRVDEMDQNGDTWMQYPVAHPQFKVWYQSYMSKEEDPEDFENLNQEDLTYLYEKSPWYQACAPDIDWIKRVEIQSIIQKYTSHSISSTINLPNKATVEDVANIYLQSWKKGLKGITVYRDGCRAGVLTTAKDEPQKEKFVAKDAPKRPECLSVDIYTTTSKGTKWNVIVGLYEGKPYEVFTIPHFTNETSMELCKKSKGKYDLENEKGLYLSDITSDMTSEEEVITRLVSTALRHGADITFIIEQLNKSHGDITSFSKAIARTLKKYANQERLNLKSTCTSCGSENIVFEEGCNKCLDCGHSGCS